MSSSSSKNQDSSTVSNRKSVGGNLNLSTASAPAPSANQVIPKVQTAPNTVKKKANASAINVLIDRLLALEAKVDELQSTKIALESRVAEQEAKILRGLGWSQRWC